MTTKCVVRKVIQNNYKTNTKNTPSKANEAVTRAGRASHEPARAAVYVDQEININQLKN
jgi:hypothetical protein